MGSRLKGVLRLIAIAYAPVVTIGSGIGFVLSVILFIPSVLRQIITGHQNEQEANQSLRFRLINWFDNWRKFVLLGEGEMPWTP